MDGKKVVRGIIFCQLNFCTFLLLNIFFYKIPQLNKTLSLVKAATLIKGSNSH